MIKDMGQNFLVDEEVLEDIITAAELTADDVVLEIGAGQGILTDALAKRVKRVVAVELDQAFVPNLVERFVKRKNVEIVHADFLKLWEEVRRDSAGPVGVRPPHLRFPLAVGERDPSLSADARVSSSKPTRAFGRGPLAPFGGHHPTTRCVASFSKDSLFVDGQFKVVANLPYGITSHALRVLLEHGPRPSMIVVMVQKEVAERVCAKPGDMSLLSLAVQWFVEPEIVRIVSPESFNPAPTVESAILKIQVHDAEKIQRDAEIEQRVFQLARIGFASRRKQLHNQLASGLRMSSVAIQQILVSVGVPEKARAQELSVYQWKELAQKVGLT